MAAPETRHECRHAVERAALGVDAGDAGKILAGQQQVLMAEEHRVDAADAGERQRGVLLARRRRARWEMPEWHSATTRSTPQARKRALHARRLDDADRRHAPGEHGSGPIARSAAS